LRAIEIGADILVKSTKVDGVYSADPVKDPNAQRYEHLSYDQVIGDRLDVMDTTAIVMCRDNNLPIRVLGLHPQGNLVRLISGEEIGTLVSDG
jgi:uridylate kinase